MTVKGRTIYHCRGKNKGKKMATYKTAKVARAIHRKIMAKRGK
jgi:hypothetical protein